MHFPLINFEIVLIYIFFLVLLSSGNRANGDIKGERTE